MGESRAYYTSKKYKCAVMILAALIICLCVTSFALAYANLMSYDNIFTTGEIKLSLQNGEPVFSGEEFMEPGMTISREFYVRNVGTGGAYYKLYFDNIQGELANYLEVTLMDGDNVLFEGMAYEFTEEAAILAEDELAVNEIKYYTIYVHLPKEAANEVQNLVFTFDLVGDAVQSKNNPDKIFE